MAGSCAGSSRESAMMTSELVAIDERRLLRRLDDLAQRGALPSGGLYRALYTPAHVAATELYADWCKEAGLLVRRDAVGNVWGRVEGSRGGRAIVTGSHIDTVRGGGALDGALGVVAGLEAVASLVAQFGRPTRILECVAICEEEGSRFSTNFWGARAIADRLEPDEAQRARDADGITLADAMRGVGLDPARASQAVRRDIDKRRRRGDGATSRCVARRGRDDARYRESRDRHGSSGRRDSGHDRRGAGAGQRRSWSRALHGGRAAQQRSIAARAHRRDREGVQGDRTRARARRRRSHAA
ncbi:MAG: M20/M25/M40 family metallo-hydrolase [Chloroflexi bacterium]|nr:MAG: M20/M25/M40 family metallo-hydrolase [Chloroflexota bacterium]